MIYWRNFILRAHGQGRREDTSACMKLAFYALLFRHVTPVSELEDGLNIVLKMIRSEAQKRKWEEKILRRLISQCFALYNVNKIKINLFNHPSVENIIPEFA